MARPTEPDFELAFEELHLSSMLKEGLVADFLTVWLWVDQKAPKRLGHAPGVSALRAGTPALLH